MSVWARYILHLLLLQKDATELAELCTELYKINNKENSEIFCWADPRSGAVTPVF